MTSEPVAVRHASDESPPSMTVASLGALDDAEFTSLIDAFLRNATDAPTSQALVQPPLVERTRAVLEGMVESVELQLNARSLDIEVLELERRDGVGLSDEQMRHFELDYARWRASALRFRGHLSAVLTRLPSSRVAQLEAAILTHRQAVGEERDEADSALWAHVTAQDQSSC